MKLYSPMSSFRTWITFSEYWFVGFTCETDTDLQLGRAIILTYFIYFWKHVITNNCGTPIPYVTRDTDYLHIVKVEEDIANEIISSNTKYM